MVTRTPGPYDYYRDRYDGVTGEALRESVDPTTTNLKALGDMRDDLKGDEKAILTQAEGDIQAGLSSKVGMPQQVADTLVGNGYFAVGCIRLMAQHIDTFDGKANDLNVKYNGRIFAAHHIPELRDTIDDWAAYRATAKAEFQGEWNKAWEQVHDDGDAVAAMFTDGPSSDEVKSLMLAGLMPMAARAYFPMVTFTPQELEKILVPEYEKALRDAGLIGPDSPAGLYGEWLEHAARNDISPEEMVKIAKEADIKPDSFDFMKDWEQIEDPDGKVYFVLPSDAEPEDARRGTLLTFILNADTGYEDADGHENNDFPSTPYSAEEVRRIMDRQETNKWSYADQWYHGALPDYRDQRSMGNGMQVTTPNGMIMGNGGPTAWSQRGGTTYGDVFWLNWDDVDDKPQALRDMIEDGYAHYTTSDGHSTGRGGHLDLDRLLHHEERHSQKWMDHGGAIGGLWMLTHNDEVEEHGGLHDGGYE